MRQHLTAVEAARQVGEARVRGASIERSTELEFIPGEVCSGEYSFSVGTAGSTLLILQTIIPALMLAQGESTLSFEGDAQCVCTPI